jgi:predicted peptidase
MRGVLSGIAALPAVLAVCIFSPCVSFAKDAEVIDRPEYILYVASGIDASQKYPLVIALSPGADARIMIDTWKRVAEDRKWMILASKEFRNGVDPTPAFARIVDILGDLSSQWPIDMSKIIASGISGGGMGSHAFAFSYPDLIAAVVINTGMMDEQFVGRGDYPRDKIAVFLASPTDFRYQEMKRDRAFLEDMGWKTNWIEFEGGHALAPQASYQEAARWLEEQLR